MTYINWKSDGNSHLVETIDQFETRKEARLMLAAYNLIDAYTGEVYLSSRSTKEWRDSGIDPAEYRGNDYKLD